MQFKAKSKSETQRCFEASGKAKTLIGKRANSPSACVAISISFTQLQLLSVRAAIRRGKVKRL